MADVEIVAWVARRWRWSEAEKTALLAEVEAEGGRVSVVAKRHRISDSLLYNWRPALKAARTAPSVPEAVAFVPIGVVGRAADDGLALLTSREMRRPERCGGHGEGGRVGMIEIALAGGTQVLVDAFVNEKALAKVFRVLKGTA